MSVKSHIYDGKAGWGLYSISLFRVRIENGKRYLKGHPISSSRWIAKKALAFTNNLIEFSLPFLQAIWDIF